jgi:hypothetical protein
MLSNPRTRQWRQHRQIDSNSLGRQLGEEGQQSQRDRDQRYVDDHQEEVLIYASLVTALWRKNHGQYPKRQYSGKAGEQRCTKRHPERAPQAHSPGQRFLQVGHVRLRP